jgi:uncharacterized protein
MARVTHFEIPTDDTARSMAFYEKAFGWKYNRFGNEDYWLAITGDDSEPGINGAIMKRKHPGQPLVNSIQVDDIRKSMKAIEENGGKIVVPMMTIPGVGYLSFFKDPDENIFGVMQEDSNAS